MNRFIPSILILVIILLPLVIAADTPPSNTGAETRCTAPEARQFDFWLGDWAITGRYRTSDSTWEEGTATNLVTLEFDSCVISENFRSKDLGLNGHSVSTWSPKLKKWRQTWVDNSGTYLDFVGGMEGDNMVLYNERANDTMTVYYRMVFSDITDDSMTWVWERSKDKKTWKRMMELFYKRND